MSNTRATLVPDIGLLLGAVFASVIAWMAGLFYLPRLFDYHVEPYTLIRRNTGR